MHPHANWRKACRRVTAALILWAAAARGDQLEPVSSAASEALALCNDADQAPVSARSALLAHGLERAEEAVSADPQDAVAHFAVFCNLGKRLQMKRDALGLFATLGELGRAQKEIDIALALAPDYSAALAAKGEMLVELPRLFGGDSRAGERLLRRAVALDPHDPRIRLMLAQVLHAAGEGEEASANAAIALSIFEGMRPASEVAATRSVLAGLH
ncbi:MAG: tetratricopeptide repeat protein [Deltaproteobacteria bacterium]|nr:MAG: tetratricopeptide repeat protein [Deltaproteobacteria bacterium]TMB17580.1 MAG: tetratricopeptide repeat protein [Deltaproteobacteria bacterium]